MAKIFVDDEKNIVFVWKIEGNGILPYTIEQIADKNNIAYSSVVDAEYNPEKKVKSAKINYDGFVEFLYEDDLITYNPNDLVSWGMSEYPAFIGTPHEYVLTTFANSPHSYAPLMLQRASLIDAQTGDTTFTDIANALISKAIELGANIGD